MLQLSTCKGYASEPPAHMITWPAQRRVRSVCAEVQQQCTMCSTCIYTSTGKLKADTRDRRKETGLGRNTHWEQNAHPRPIILDDSTQSSVISTKSGLKGKGGIKVMTLSSSDRWCRVKVIFLIFLNPFSLLSSGLFHKLPLNWSPSTRRLIFFPCRLVTFSPAFHQSNTHTHTITSIHLRTCSTETLAWRR